ncbi:MAG TPA: hypothetical protein VHW01_06800 [Polyangiaceae bacterium]|jgi:hypothetical protein|nr:hypothetical protein [Polyangiaceae bacterium]
MTAPLVRAVNVPAPVAEPLRAWHRGGEGRVLRVANDGSVVLIQLDFGGRREARYESADEAIAAISTNTIAWRERGPEKRKGVFVR